MLEEWGEGDGVPGTGGAELLTTVPPLQPHQGAEHLEKKQDNPWSGSYSLFGPPSLPIDWS